MSVHTLGVWAASPLTSTAHGEGAAGMRPPDGRCFARLSGWSCGRETLRGAVSPWIARLMPEV